MTRQDWNPPTRRRRRGGPIVAGSLLLLISASQLLLGYVAAGGEAFGFSGGVHWYRAETTAWGWANIAVGLVGVVAALALLGVSRRLGRRRGKRTLAVLVAVVSAVNQCFLAPRYPLLAASVIVLDLFLVWAVTTQTDWTGEDAEDGIARLDAPAPAHLAPWYAWAVDPSKPRRSGSSPRTDWTTPRR
ncbi:MAG TPA: hypothetical protein VKZ65_15435 [Glycomyces sp.]|nr:hypothetical protein [Glycomyces sp.]